MPGQSIYQAMAPDPLSLSLAKNNNLTDMY